MQDHLLDALRGQRVIVTGAAGQVGEYLCPVLEAHGAEVLRFGHHPGASVVSVFELTQEGAVRDVIVRAKPDAIIHTAGYTDVDGAERDPELAMAVNGGGSARIAEAAKEAGAYLIGIGSDFVFPGTSGAPYGEDDPTDPVNAYGRSKLAGEQAILGTDPGFAVARTAWVFGGPGKHFPRTILRLLREQGEVEVVDDELSSPTYALDLAEGLAALTALRAPGIFHLVNEGRTTRYGLAREVAIQAGFDPSVVRPRETIEPRRMPMPAKRPHDSSLRNERAAALGVRLRPWQDAVAYYVPRLVREMGLRAAAARRGTE